MTCNNVDEHEGYDAKWNKPDSERQMWNGITYLQNIKKKVVSLGGGGDSERLLKGYI